MTELQNKLRLLLEQQEPVKKPRKQRKPMSDEAKTKARANLAKAREKGKILLMARAEKKRALKQTKKIAEMEELKEIIPVIEKSLENKKVEVEVKKDVIEVEKDVIEVKKVQKVAEKVAEKVVEKVVAVEVQKFLEPIIHRPKIEPKIIEVIQPKVIDVIQPKIKINVGSKFKFF
jgi:hypothetical protein